MNLMHAQHNGGHDTLIMGKMAAAVGVDVNASSDRNCERVICG